MAKKKGRRNNTNSVARKAGKEVTEMTGDKNLDDIADEVDETSNQISQQASIEQAAESSDLKEDTDVLPDFQERTVESAKGVEAVTEAPASEKLEEDSLVKRSEEKEELIDVAPEPIKDVESVDCAEDTSTGTNKLVEEKIYDDSNKEDETQKEALISPTNNVAPKTPVRGTSEEKPVEEGDEILKQKTAEIEHDILSFNTPPLPPRAHDPPTDASQTPSALLPPRSPSATQSPISPPLPPRHVRKHAVPPPLHEELKSEEFRKNMTGTSEPPPMPPRGNRDKRLDSAADVNLIVNRYCQTSHHYQRQDEHSREGLERGKDLLKTSYSAFLDSLPKTVKPAVPVEPSEETTLGDELQQLDDDERALIEVDWGYWTQVVKDFASVASDPDKFEQKIAGGIPPQIRGIIWQLIANSKSTEFEDIFVTLLNTQSPHEASIRKDLKRTKFIPGDKVESLFNVMKVYSIYDPDVGYTQGMAFITTPLILNCETEAESFGLLVRLMKSYGLRELFLPEMPGLMLLLYQFDRLFEENSPQLYNHLTRQGIRSSMYATQWFLTFFAYRFPLAFVLRIYDIVFAEGIESILRIAVNLMVKNAKQLLALKFDKLLDFLKNELFAYYLIGSVRDRSYLEQDEQDGEKSEASSVIKRDLNTTGTDQSLALNGDDYDINAFVHDAMNDVHVTPISLKRYAAEYEEIHQIEQQKEAQFESIRIKNKQLQHEVRKLEHDYTLLNREHIEIANELIKNRLRIETLLDENNDQKLMILDLKKQLQEEIRKQQLPNPDSAIPSDLREDLDRTIKRNAEVMSSNLKLQDKINEQEKIIEALRAGNRASSPGSVPFKQPLAGAFSKLFKNDNS
ncbi:hypothetical protein HG537_0F01230 [Torulaspora globosa]|uniref:GTPase-activating protein GYP5 n=1 Tax=Torulaspora globosa TaxID=48254 RepID=A0A7H9HY38_9SACH|nr:hypothetical protein HG537_0F01230 [Torulaspora sp. CBS 2947]